MSCDLDEARYRLREWAYYHRDRARKHKAGSAEGNWRSPQIWYPEEPKPGYDQLQAIKTHEILKDRNRIPTLQYRALTWRYCYPFVPIHIALRWLSRRTNTFPGGPIRRVNLKEYQELVTIGEMRFAAALFYTQEEKGYSPTPSGHSRAITQSREALAFAAES